MISVEFVSLKDRAIAQEKLREHWPLWGRCPLPRDEQYRPSHNQIAMHCNELTAQLPLK